MKTPAALAAKRQPLEEVLISALMEPSARRTLQRRAKAGTVERIHPGIYIQAENASTGLDLIVRRNWQRIAGTIVPGGVVSHASAMSSGLQADNTLMLSHPTLFGKKIALPGLTLVLLRGPGPLPGDMPLSQTGLHWSGQTRMLLENVGNKAPRRLGRQAVESQLIDILNASGEKALNQIRDQAAALAEPMGMAKEVALLRKLIGALLGTHALGELRTRSGQLLARGTPADKAHISRFERLATYLRGTAVPNIPNKVTAGAARHHFAFIESYFSNYVEGTKFDIEEARGIVMDNAVVASRPKDSHDVLGVFRLATTAPFRDSPPVAGEDFLPGLQTWHGEMLRMRPEARPGQTKLQLNYAGTTQFVEPGMVRGTLEEGSRMALSVPEGLSRAVYYAFLVSEVHPFDDGNGRLSRLVMNAELSRVGLNRIIIPTLYHPQYVDCARVLTRQDEPEGFVRSLANMARWCSQFDYTDLDKLIAALKQTNALEESPAQYKLLNLDGAG